MAFKERFQTAVQDLEFLMDEAMGLQKEFEAKAKRQDEPEQREYLLNEAATWRNRVTTLDEVLYLLTRND